MSHGSSLTFDECVRNTEDKLKVAVRYNSVISKIVSNFSADHSRDRVLRQKLRDALHQGQVVCEQLDSMIGVELGKLNECICNVI
jgi:hypothetical protein